MKNASRVLLAIIFTFTLISCSVPLAETKYNNVSDYQAVPQKLLDIECVLLSESESTPSENSVWIEAYADFFMENGRCHPPFLMLLDVDFDDIPELFFIASGFGANMWIFTILSFSEYGIEQINIEKEMPAGLELYKDKQTGEMRWMNLMEAFRSNFYNYHNELRWIDFNNFSEIRTEFIFAWDMEIVAIDTGTDGFGVFYYLLENADERVQVGFDEIEKHKQEIFSRYMLIETQRFFAFINDFAMNDGVTISSENLDRRLIVELL